MRNKNFHRTIKVNASAEEAMAQDALHRAAPQSCASEGFFM